MFKVPFICLQIHTDYVTFSFEKRFLSKECKEHSIVCTIVLMIINKIVLVLMLLTVSLWFKILLDLLFTKMNARSRIRIFF